MVGFGNGYRLGYCGEPVNANYIIPEMMTRGTLTISDFAYFVADDSPRTTLTNCTNCGAPLRGKKKRCEYCATEF